MLNMSNNDTQKHWFAFSMREPLIMNTTLALSGNGWLATMPNPDPRIRQEVLRQKGQAIKTVNTLLGQSDLTDTLISAVANLANVSVSNRHPFPVQSGRAAAPRYGGPVVARAWLSPERRSALRGRSARQTHTSGASTGSSICAAAMRLFYMLR